MKEEHIDFLIIIGSIGNFICVGIFGYFIYLSNWRRTLAYQGDLNSAVRILLPCYRPIFRWMMFVYSVFGIGMALSLLGADSVETQFYVLQLYSLLLMTTFMLGPLLLMQSSISYKALFNCAKYIIPWLILCTSLWIASHPYSRVKSWTSCVIFFWIFTAAPPIIIALLLLTKIFKSRIVIKSWSNRSAVDHMLLYAIFFITTSGVAAPSLFSQEVNSDELLNVSIALAIMSFVWNQLFPWALYRTLLADTKYWRGLGKHHEGFIIEEENDENTGNTKSVFKPNVMDLRLVTHDLQSAMRDVSNIVVDFAFLSIKKRIGEGSHAHVFSGMLRHEPVAVKVFVPSEVNQEVIKEFLREAKLSKAIQHKNVVGFCGVCVRPPQIAMVMEFCEGGNLKSNIMKNKDQWTPLMRANACFDATLAIEYLHDSGFIHRDIKAENFLVAFPIDKPEPSSDDESTRSSMSSRANNAVGFGNRRGSIRRELPTKEAMGRIQEDFIVKLGDFGESCKKRLKQDGSISNVRNSLVLRPISTGFSWKDGSESLYGDFDEEGDGGILAPTAGPQRMSIKGTAGFMAPELVAAAKVYNESVDIYALGVTFWEIWTGSDPYAGLSVFKVHEMVEKGVRPEMPPEIPEGMRPIIDSCWAQDARQRATASELLSQLEGFIMDEYGVDNNYRHCYGSSEAEEVRSRLSKSVSSTGLGIRDMAGSAVRSAVRSVRLSATGSPLMTGAALDSPGEGGSGRESSASNTPVFRSKKTSSFDRTGNSSPSGSDPSFSGRKKAASEGSPVSLRMPDNKDSEGAAVDDGGDGAMSPLHQKSSSPKSPKTEADVDEEVTRMSLGGIGEDEIPQEHDEGEFSMEMPVHTANAAAHRSSSTTDCESNTPSTHDEIAAVDVRMHAGGGVGKTGQQGEDDDDAEAPVRLSDSNLRRSTISNAGAIMKRNSRGSVLAGRKGLSGKRNNSWSTPAQRLSITEKNTGEGEE
jgi:serine/threonine protein kinase